MNETNQLIIQKNKNSKMSYLFSFINKDFFMHELGLNLIGVNFYLIKVGFFFFFLFYMAIVTINSQNIFGNNNECIEKDPIYMLYKRIEIKNDVLCSSASSSHVCYRNTFDDYQSNKGVICKMTNFILDPSKWQSDDSDFKGPIDYKVKGFPLVSKGLFNMKCDYENAINDASNLYEFYFNSWNYTINNNNNFIMEEKYDELISPQKIIFFISRNHESANLFSGGLGFLNAFALMNLYSIKPENIQIVFLESVNYTNDSFYELYKELISRGGEPIHISSLTKKYHISNAIHIPLNWDSPCFIFSEIPKCKKQTQTYELLNKYIKDYMNIPKFKDSIGYDKEIFFYPKTIINPNSKIYNKYLTVQWRRVWPKERTGQQRVMGNGPELVEALADCLPKNILIRLVDTSRLSIREQIAIMQKTDYFIGEHGSGLFLSIFLPTHSVVQEIAHKESMNAFQLMSSLSGHTTYFNIINAKVEIIDNNEVLFFDIQNFSRIVVNNMKKTNFNMKNY